MLWWSSNSVVVFNRIVQGGRGRGGGSCGYSTSVRRAGVAWRHGTARLFRHAAVPRATSQQQVRMYHVFLISLLADHLPNLEVSKSPNYLLHGFRNDHSRQFCDHCITILTALSACRGHRPTLTRYLVTILFLRQPHTGFDVGAMDLVRKTEKIDFPPIVL